MRLRSSSAPPRSSRGSWRRPAFEPQRTAMTSRIVSLPTADHPAAASAEVVDLPGRHDASPRPRATSNALPAAPRHAEETGLPLLLLTELLLKVMHQHGLQTLHDLAVHLKLGPALVEELCATLRKDTLVEVRRRGELDGDVTYEMTQAGRARAGLRHLVAV